MTRAPTSHAWARAVIDEEQQTLATLATTQVDGIAALWLGLLLGCCWAAAGQPLSAQGPHTSTPAHQHTSTAHAHTSPPPGAAATASQRGPESQRPRMLDCPAVAAPLSSDEQPMQRACRRGTTPRARSGTGPGCNSPIQDDEDKGQG
jgi:hypothetical protein